LQDLNRVDWWYGSRQGFHAKNPAEIDLDGFHDHEGRSSTDLDPTRVRTEGPLTRNIDFTL
jgi:hypothetical protein